MNGMRKPETIAERVYTVLSMDEGTNGPLDHCHRPLLKTVGGSLGTFELDCIDWGLTYGIAYALARAEDPFERQESVAGRAEEAARIAYEGWGSGVATIERPDMDKLTANLIKAYENADQEGPSLPRDLESALIAFTNAVGNPA